MTGVVVSTSRRRQPLSQSGKSGMVVAGRDNSGIKHRTNQVHVSNVNMSHE